METKKLVQTAMFTALVLLATVVFKIQTPVIGYIHLGDAFVLLAGIILGPLSGGLAAGLGSALADFVGGYLIWCPGTFIIKFLTAFTAAKLFHGLSRFYNKSGCHLSQSVASGIAGESLMVLGYFLYNILVVMFGNGSFSADGFSESVIVSTVEIPFNIIQGAAGIAIGAVLLPIFNKIAKRINGQVMV